MDLIMDLITKIRQKTGLSYRALALCITQKYKVVTSGQCLQQSEMKGRKSIRLPLLMALNKMMMDLHPELGKDWVLRQVDKRLKSW